MLDKIKIGYLEYEIETVEPKESPLFINGDECTGTVDWKERKIYLNKNNSEETNIDTLIHETLHCIEEMYYINLGEEIVHRLSTAIATVLHDNNLEIVKK